MKTRKFITCVAIVALLGAFAALAETSDHVGFHPFRHAILANLTGAGVSDAQKEQIRVTLREFRPAVQPLVRQLVQERRALRGAIHSSPVDEAAIRAQSARVAQVEADLAVKRAYVSERIRAGLTPDQIAKLKQLAGKVDAKIDAAIYHMGEKIAGQ